MRNPFAAEESLTAAGEPKMRRVTIGELTASARVDSLGDKRSSDGGNGPGSQSRMWQQRAWGYYDELGECHYSASFLGACLSRISLTVGVRDREGHVGPAFDDEGNPVTDEAGNPIPGVERAEEALEYIRALKNDVGGQSELMRAIGINMMVAGELHLVGRPRKGDNRDVSQMSITELNWEVLSTEEFRAQGEDYEHIPYPGAVPRAIKSTDAHVIRIWRKHPRFSELPDSSIRANLDILEELLLLTREVRGEAMSRLAKAGILLVPEEIQYGGDDDGDDQGDAGDPFTRDLINTMSTAIADKSSAAGVVPFVVRAPADLLDKIRLIEFAPQSSDSAQKRTEAVQRYAQGVELPVEITTGHAGTTFANAVSIDDSLYKSHIEPVVEIGCDALTAGYLVPALGGDTPLVVHYDSSELVTRPNRAQDAKDAYDRFELSGKGLRESMGFSEASKPDEEEVARRIEIAKATGKGGGQQPVAGNGGPLNQGDLDGGNNLDGELTAAVQAAAEVSLHRALYRAGARLRGKANSTTQMSLSTVPDPEVAATLGKEVVQKLFGENELFAGEFDSLRTFVAQKTGDPRYADEIRDFCLRASLECLYRPRAATAVMASLSPPLALSHAG